MWMRDTDGAVRVRCPHCLEADWRTRIQLNEQRPFTCYICFCLSDRPLPGRDAREGCPARLRRLGGAVGGLFRRGRRGASL